MVRDRVIIITGASRGIGLAAAVFLAKRGAKVVAASRDKDTLLKVAEGITGNPGACIAVPTDVSNEMSVKNLICQTINHFGRIDILINNAGTVIYGPVSQASVQDWEQVMNTNLKGVFLCTREVIPHMIRQGTGHIITVASQAGKYGFPKLAAYCASKYGVIGFSESIKRELAPYNIRVSYLCPGFVDTDLLKTFPEEMTRGVNKATPEDIAREIHQLIIGEKEDLRLRRFFKKISKFAKKKGMHKKSEMI
jgi:NAD(P)-dependent dehydrogenase (short-subunit alcohol dehydrogenase family)